MILLKPYGRKLYVYIVLLIKLGFKKKKRKEKQMRREIVGGKIIKRIEIDGDTEIKKMRETLWATYVLNSLHDYRLKKKKNCFFPL